MLVNQQTIPSYLSEIPIFLNGENIGQIDIDSNTIDPFTKADEDFLEFVCEKVATIL